MDFSNKKNSEFAKKYGEFTKKMMEEFLESFRTNHARSFHSGFGFTGKKSAFDDGPTPGDSFDKKGPHYGYDFSGSSYSGRFQSGYGQSSHFSGFRHGFSSRPHSSFGFEAHKKPEYAEYEVISSELAPQDATLPSANLKDPYTIKEPLTRFLLGKTVKEKIATQEMFNNLRKSTVLEQQKDGSFKNSRYIPFNPMESIFERYKNENKPKVETVDAECEVTTVEKNEFKVVEMVESFDFTPRKDGIKPEILGQKKHRHGFTVDEQPNPLYTDRDHPFFCYHNKGFTL